MANSVTFWVGGSGGEGKGAGDIGGRLFKKPGYFTTDDPKMIEILRNSTNVAREIIEDDSDLLGIAPEKLKTLNHADLQAICEKFHVSIGTRKEMIAAILGVITPSDSIGE